jgi:hypothetical protein
MRPTEGAVVPKPNKKKTVNPDKLKLVQRVSELAEKKFEWEDEKKILEAKIADCRDELKSVFPKIARGAEGDRRYEGPSCALVEYTKRQTTIDEELALELIEKKGIPRKKVMKVVFDPEKFMALHGRGLIDEEELNECVNEQRTYIFRVDRVEDKKGSGKDVKVSRLTK